MARRYEYVDSVIVDEEVEEAPVASSSPTEADRTKAAEEEFLRALDDF